LSFENKLVAYLITLGAIQMTTWANELNNFSGTENYYRITPDTIITDGAKFVADKAGAYWLMTAIASYLPDFTNKETFIVANLKVTRTATACTALLKLDDGNDNVLAEQFIEYTDFELDELKLYACYNGDVWVIMLPKEY
jgi:hypothetical protein